MQKVMMKSNVLVFVFFQRIISCMDVFKIVVAIVWNLTTLP
jgi:hypothetical protein